MDDLQNFFCWNKECPEYGIRGGNNIRVRGLYGKQHDIRLLYCLTCKERFSERRGTVFFDSRLPSATTVSLLEHVVEGTGNTTRVLFVCNDFADFSYYEGTFVSITARE